MAAELAQDGFSGPPQILEGKFGFLNTFCRDADVSRLTADLGRVWRTLTTTLKAYACHSTAHVAVTAVMELRARHGICGDDIESIRVAGSEKLVSHHSIHDPQDIAMAQYSAPFSIALACYRDPRDPAAFCEDSLNDPAIRSLCRKTVLELYQEAPKNNQLASKVTVQLKDGRELVQELQYFPGMPQRPLTSGQLWEKFHRLTAALPRDRKRSLFDSFLALETISDVAQLEFI